MIETDANKDGWILVSSENIPTDLLVGNYDFLTYEGYIIIFGPVGGGPPIWTLVKDLCNGHKYYCRKRKFYKS